MIMVCTAGAYQIQRNRCAFVAVRLNITYASASMVPRRHVPVLAAQFNGGTNVGLSIAANVVLLVSCIALIAMLISCEKAFKRCYDYAATKSIQPNSQSNAVSAYSDMANLLSLRGKR